MKKEKLSDDSYFLIEGADVSLPFTDCYTIEGAKQRFNNLNRDFMHSLKLHRVINGRKVQILPEQKPKKVYVHYQPHRLFYQAVNMH